MREVVEADSPRGHSSFLPFSLNPCIKSSVFAQVNYCLFSNCHLLLLNVRRRFFKKPSNVLGVAKEKVN